jgi:hypothetical protein
VVLQVVTPCGFVAGYRRFEGTYHLHLQVGEIWMLNMKDSPKQGGRMGQKGDILI